MKNLLRTIVTFSLVMAMLISLATIVHADSPEILKDPGFEGGISSDWKGYLGATLTAENTIKHSGNSSVLCAARSAKHDTPIQNVTNTVAFYGMGEYKVSAWVYLTAADANVQIVVMVTCDDKTFGPVPDGHAWSFTPFITAKKGAWTKLEGLITLESPATSKIVSVDYYLNFDEKDTEAQFKQDYYQDDCSLIKTGSVKPMPTADPNAEPTEKPIVSSPATLTLPPATLVPIPTTTSALPTIAPTPTIIPAASEGNNNLWLWIMGPIIVIGFGVGGFFLGRMSKKPPIENTEPKE